MSETWAQVPALNQTAWGFENTSSTAMVSALAIGYSGGHRHMPVSPKNSWTGYPKLSLYEAQSGRHTPRQHAGSEPPGECLIWWATALSSKTASGRELGGIFLSNSKLAKKIMDFWASQIQVEFSEKCWSGNWFSFKQSKWFGLILLKHSFM